MRYVSALILLISLYGCTGSVGDDGTDWPPPTDVQLIVRDGFVVQKGVHVLFQTADEALISEVITDGNGFAQAQMPDGGNVTVIRSYPGQIPSRPDELYTYVGAKPGDRIVMGAPTSDSGPAAINVLVPNTGDNANGNYRVVTPCGSGEGPAPRVPITIDGCPGDTDFYLRDQNSNQSALVHAAISENVDLSLTPLSEALASTISATNVQPDTTVNAELKIATTGGFTLYSTGEKQVTTTPANVDLPDMVGVDQYMVADVARNAGGHQMIVAHDTYGGTSVSIDVGAAALAYVTQPKYERLSISWTEEAPGAPADFVVAMVTVTKDNALDPPGPGERYVRTIIAPYTGPTLKMPVMPGVYAAAYTPGEKDQIQGTHALGTATGGYDAVRARVYQAETIGEMAPMYGKLILSYPGNTPPGR